MATQRTRQTKRKAEEPEEEMLRLYEPFRFLATEHWGEFLCVVRDGQYIVGPEEIRSWLFVFKVGPISMGRLGWSSMYS